MNIERIPDCLFDEMSSQKSEAIRVVGSDEYVDGSSYLKVESQKEILERRNRVDKMLKKYSED